MKLKILLIGLVLFLGGCVFPFNRPAVGPEGTIAFFVNEEGQYDFFAQSGTLALLQDGKIFLLENTAIETEGGSIAWSPEGDELIYLEMEPSELGLPETWKLQLVKPQTSSEKVTLLTSPEPILNPAFTPEGDITYLQGSEEEEIIHLFVYDRAKDAHSPMLEDVLSYRPFSPTGTLAIIQTEGKEDLQLATVSTYNPDNEEITELAKFYLSKEMQEAFLMLPAPFLWDVDIAGKWLALTLYDRVLIEPEVTGGEPSLYLINTEEETGEQIAAIGALPAFSPDGNMLAYIGSAKEEKDQQITCIYNLQTGEQEQIEGSLGTSGLFWIDKQSLGIIFETDEGYRINKYLLATDQWEPLFP